jgi:hypothetical protein
MLQTLLRLTERAGKDLGVLDLALGNFGKNVDFLGTHGVSVGVQNVLREVLFAEKPLIPVLYADPSASVHLPLVIDPVPAGQILLIRAVAIFKRAHIWPQISEDVSPVNRQYLAEAERMINDCKTKRNTLTSNFGGSLRRWTGS